MSDPIIESLLLLLEKANEGSQMDSRFRDAIANIKAMRTATLSANQVFWKTRQVLDAEGVQLGTRGKIDIK